MLATVVWRCTECGHSAKWTGRCEACAAWNSVSEEPAGERAPRGGSAVPIGIPPIRLRDVEGTRLERWSTGLPELDFVLGGGLVPGSMTLIGGEPGIGKSTLLLQAAARLEASGRTVLYASGEESPEQLRLRAGRLGAGVVGQVIGETRLEAVLRAGNASRGGSCSTRSDGLHRGSRALPAMSGMCASAPACERFAKQRGWP